MFLIRIKKLEVFLMLFMRTEKHTLARKIRMVGNVVNLEVQFSCESNLSRRVVAWVKENVLRSIWRRDVAMGVAIKSSHVVDENQKEYTRTTISTTA